MRQKLTLESVVLNLATVHQIMQKRMASERLVCVEEIYSFSLDAVQQQV